MAGTKNVDREGTVKISLNLPEDRTLNRIYHSRLKFGGWRKMGKPPKQQLSLYGQYLKEKCIQAVLVISGTKNHPKFPSRLDQAFNWATAMNATETWLYELLLKIRIKLSAYNLSMKFEKNRIFISSYLSSWCLPFTCVLSQNGCKYIQWYNWRMIFRSVSSMLFQMNFFLLSFHFVWNTKTIVQATKLVSLYGWFVRREKSLSF